MRTSVPPTPINLRRAPFLQVFDELLLDADWSVNAGMWMWLSCSSFFQQFFHCYCPVRFGRKTDPNGDFIRYVTFTISMTVVYVLRCREESKFFYSISKNLFAEYVYHQVVASRDGLGTRIVEKFQPTVGHWYLKNISSRNIA